MHKPGHEPTGFAPRSQTRWLGAQILNASRDAENQDDDDKEPDEAHSQHHPNRHISHLHHVERLPLVRARGGEPARVFSTAAPMTVMRGSIFTVAAQHVIAGNLLRGQ
jgi:hypothetical protein